MGDTDTGADDKSKAEQGSDASDEKAQDGQQDKEEAADQGDKADDADKGNDGKKPEEKEEKIEDDGAEPVVRRPKTAKDYIIERKQRQLDKAKKAEEKSEDKADDGDKNDADDADDEIAPEDEQLVEKIVDKKLEPLLEERRKAEDDSAIKDYLAENPELKPFEAKVRRFMKHESRAHLPVGTIFLEAAGSDFFMKMGAKRAQKAADEAKKGGTGGGGSNRNIAEPKRVSEMSDAEFKAEQERVRRGQ